MKRYSFQTQKHFIFLVSRLCERYFTLFNMTRIPSWGKIILPPQQMQVSKLSTCLIILQKKIWSNWFEVKTYICCQTHWVNHLKLKFSSSHSLFSFSIPPWANKRCIFMKLGVRGHQILATYRLADVGLSDDKGRMKDVDDNGWHPDHLSQSCHPGSYMVLTCQVNLV